ncbi:MAG TPA: ABC transporter ATP-binding protein [Bacteroidia bacterium]|jgi:ATP-binding cassette subfamily B multidrug efflux pump|nr:ABC transporter ATP-binding protein [Bacteroidia bacterium]
MKALKYLNKFFIKYKWRLLLGFVFVAVSNVLLVSQGIVIKNATDEFATNNFSDKKVFLIFAGELLALTLLSGFFMFLKRQFIIVMSRMIEYDLKNEIYIHYQKLDLNFYKRNRTGDLMNRISEDVGRVRMYVGPAIMYIVDTVITITTVVAFMWHESIELTLLVLAPLPVLSIIVFKVSSTINRRSGRAQEALSGITSVAQETFAGIRVAKAYNKEEHFLQSFIKQAEEYKQKNLSLARIDGSFQPFLVFMVGLSLLSIIFFGGKMYAAGEINSVGNFPQFVFYVFKLTWPFASFGWVLSLTQRAAASQERINQFLKMQPEIVNTGKKEFNLDGEIEFKNVSYTYPDTGITALKNVSFTIAPGKTLGIIGKSGSGKTTIGQMLLRFMDADKGEILVNKSNLKEINLKQFRDKTGYVQQDVFLFSDSVKNNIAFSGDFTETEIEQAAKNAVVYDNILQLPEKFETVVGERGVTLSGGQKQRVAIARAIIKNPKLFIFDDCLSAVDADTEHQILSNLKEITSDRTGVIISHRVSSLQHADEIIVLEHGEVIERGSHAELLIKKGNYYNLYQKQNLQEA